MIKVSVIITTYKRSEMLTRAIDSVLNQTYKNIEIIVVDDNDENSIFRKETSLIMERYKGNKNIIYLKHKKNSNGSVARNTGIYNSNGELITFLDDDDWYYPEKVEKQVEFLRINTDFKAVYCACNRDNKIIPSMLSGDLSLEILSGRNLIYTNSIMMWKNVILEFEGWDESYKKHQEAAFLLRYFSKGHKIGAMNNVLVEFDISDRSNFPNSIDNEQQIRKYLNDNIDKINLFSKDEKKLIILSRGRGVILSHLKNWRILHAMKVYLKLFIKYPLAVNLDFLVYSKNKVGKKYEFLK